MQQHLEYLGRQLRHLRGELDMTQAELAAKLGVNQSYIATLERAKDGKQPTIEFLLTVCNYFNVGIDDLLGTHRDGKMPESDLDRLPENVREPVEQLIRSLAREARSQRWQAQSNLTHAIAGDTGVSAASRAIGVVVSPNDNGMAFEKA